MENDDNLLLQTLQLLDILSERTNAMVAALDKDFCYTYLNKAYRDEILRLSGKQAKVGMSLMEVFGHMPDQLKIATNEWKLALKGEKTSKTIRFGDPDHYQKIYDSSHLPIRNAEGHIVGGCVVAYDVTERIQAEEALQQTDARYQSLFNSMSEGFALHEILYDESGQPADYRIVDVNLAFERLTGILRTTVIGRTLSEALPVDSQDWIRKFSPVAMTGESKHLELFSKSLEKHFGVIAYRPNENQLATVFTDISEQKSADSVRNWLSSFPELSPLPIFEIDLENHISYQNPICQELFPDLIAQGSSHPLMSNVAGFKESFRVGGPDQAVFEVLVGNAWYKQTVLYVSDNQRLRIYSVDITDRVEAEAALRALNAQLEEAVYLRTQELQVANKKLKVDVRRRIEVEKALKNEQQRFYEVLEILPMYLVLLTPDYHIAFANRYFREHFGDPQDRLCYECLFKHKAPCENCESFKVFEVKGPHQWHWRGPNKRHYDVHDFPFKDSDGSSLILEMGIDVTEKVQAQERLSALNAYNRSLIEASLDTLVTITTDGKIGDVNVATEVITGYNRDELIGTDFHNYFTDPEKARAGLSASIRYRHCA